MNCPGELLVARGLTTGEQVTSVNPFFFLLTQVHKFRELVLILKKLREPDTETGINISEFTTRIHNFISPAAKICANAETHRFFKLVSHISQCRLAAALIITAKRARRIIPTARESDLLSPRTDEQMKFSHASHQPRIFRFSPLSPPESYSALLCTIRSSCRRPRSGRHER